MLSLLARLIASQSAVFSIWFSRRGYERSRGEMITMLYEKTLSRKVIGIHPALQENSSIEVNVDDNVYAMKYTKSNRKRPLSRFILSIRTKFRPVSNPFREVHTIPNSKQPASTGKILNLMR